MTKKITPNQDRVTLPPGGQFYRSEPAVKGKVEASRTNLCEVDVELHFATDATISLLVNDRPIRDARAARPEVLDGLRLWQLNEQGREVPVAIDSAGQAGLQQRVTVRTRVGAGDSVG